MPVNSCSVVPESTDSMSSTRVVPVIPETRSRAPSSRSPGKTTSTARVTDGSQPAARGRAARSIASASSSR